MNHANPNASVACCSWPKPKYAFGWQMERIFSGAWKDKHGKTRTNAEDLTESANASNESNKNKDEVYFASNKLQKCMSILLIPAN